MSRPWFPPWPVLGLLAVASLAACARDPALPNPDAGEDAAITDARPDVSLLLDGRVDAAQTTDASLADAALPDAGLPPDGGAVSCPADMVVVDGTFCMDRYEASRPDATAIHPGVLSTHAVSQPGVLPWTSYSLTRTEAAAACAAAGKRLCTNAEWPVACQGPAQTIYSYGDTYDPVICNGIDRFCYCGVGEACEGVSPCPYPHCFNQPPPAGAPPASCGAAFRVRPTGSHPSCTNAYGLFDMNGNVWEVVDAGDALQHFRGGAYNCSDSELLHRCDYDATWGPSAKGFRCCRAPL